MFTEAYAVIPKGTNSDIVTSLLPFWEKARFWVIARPLSGFAETFSHYIAEVLPDGGSTRPETEAGVEAGEGPEPGPGPGPSTRWLVVAGFPASEEAVVMEAVLSEVAAQAGDAAARRAEAGVEREYEAGWALLAVPVALDPPRVTN